MTEAAHVGLVRLVSYGGRHLLQHLSTGEVADLGGLRKLTFVPPDSMGALLPYEEAPAPSPPHVEQAAEGGDDELLDFPEEPSSPPKRSEEEEGEPAPEATDMS